MGRKHRYKSSGFKRPNIVYPPVPTRKWVPPDQRKRKKPVKQPPYPPQLTTKLEVSNLEKIWHDYRIINDCGVLLGNYSMYHCRFNYYSNGLQAPCICTVAVLFSKMTQCPFWSSATLDGIVTLGDRYYVQCRRKECRNKQHLKISDLMRNLYLYNHKVTIDFKGKPYNGILYKDIDNNNKDYLATLLLCFFETYSSGIIVVHESPPRFFATWKLSKLMRSQTTPPTKLITTSHIAHTDNGYFLFDPADHDDMCWPWKDVVGRGKPFLVRFRDVEKLVVVIQRQFICPKNHQVTIHPVDIERIVFINTDFPDCLFDAHLEELDSLMKERLRKEMADERAEKALRRAKRLAKRPESESEWETDDDEHTSDTLITDVVQATDHTTASSEHAIVEPERKQESKLKTQASSHHTERHTSHHKASAAAAAPKRKRPIVEKPHVQSVTYFNYIVPDRIGIMQAETHQFDDEFSRAEGMQDICNAVAALVILRTTKSKYWTTKILTNVLRLGFRICIESRRTVCPHLQHQRVNGDGDGDGDNVGNAYANEPRLKLTNLEKHVQYEERSYTPHITQYGAVGRLQSSDDAVLDLLPALREVFSEYDTVVLQGPIVVAIWKEDGFYYMFDPNERDPNGYAITKAVCEGSCMRTIEHQPGFACLTWFRDLRDLVDVYMKNVERNHRRDQFIISTVQIKDAVVLPEKWNNFEPVACDRWICRGSFSQSNRKFTREIRNTQCTANCAMAIAFAHIVPVTEWTCETLDEILTRGNAYYKSCIESLQRRNLFKNHMLLVSELTPDFIVGDKLVSMDVAECAVNGLITIPDDYKCTTNLKQGLSEFFTCADFAIMSCRGISIAIWRRGDEYFYFDSHDRDEQGFYIPHGKSCIQRFTSLNRLCECIMANLGPSPMHAIFNLNRIEISIYNIPQDPEPDEDDAISNECDEEEQASSSCNLAEITTFERPLHSFKKLTKKRAILQADRGQSDPVFGSGAGKQTIPNLLAAIAMARIFIPAQWTVDIMNDVLQTGNDIYNESIQAYYKRQNEENLRCGEDQDENDDITMDNVIKEFKIGVNKFTVDPELILEGPIMEQAEEFSDAIMHYFKRSARDVDDYFELVVQTGLYDVIVWKQNNLYYLFDPRHRDGRGEIFGKEEWSDVPLMQPDAQSAHCYMDNYGFDGELEDYLEREWLQLGIDGENEEAHAEEEERAHKPKHPPEYWEDFEAKHGRSCILWFTNLKCLLKHLIDNCPPVNRPTTNFRLYKLVMHNEPDVKEVYNPVRPDDGDWHNFSEINKRQWILRGSMNQRNHMFPESNRGLQTDANCIIALAFAELYAMSKFNKQTIDQILKYGDRLYTHTKKMRRKELEQANDQNLTAAEIDDIINKDVYTIDKLVKKFCIGDDSVTANVQFNYISGEVHAQDVQDEMDVKRGLIKFFRQSDNHLCVLSSKAVSIAIWRIGDYYYLFDPQECGPHGAHRESGGNACIMRCLDIEFIVEVFLANIPRIGKNFFQIHAVQIQQADCKTPVKEELRKVDSMKLTGFMPITPGRLLIRGSTHQDHVQFGRGTNAQCAPIAFVALAMTLIHNCEFWTRPIIDEIIAIGDKIYANMLDRCDLDFNPWEERLTVAMAPNDFRIGRIKVNCELRHTEQRGIIDIKDPNVQNLRQGIQRFFEENSYGVLETDFLTVAIWEAEDSENQNYLYMFDPNARGPTGMPMLEDGTACVLKFCGPKMISDHIISLISMDRQGSFVITPIEIAIERDGKRKKTKRYGMNTRPKSCCKCCETMHTLKLGRKTYYVIGNGEMALLRGTRSQNSRIYSPSSRNNQDIPNCIVSYIFDKLIPLSRWTYKTIDMILDIGDQLYKDSYMIYNPKEKKLRLETLIRDVVIKDIRVKISVGAPVLTAKFNVQLLTEAVQACFNMKTFCIILVDQSAVALFKRDEFFYLFDPSEVDLHGRRAARGYATVMRFNELYTLINVLMNNLQAGGLYKEVFHVIVVAIKEIERVPVGTTFMEKNPKIIKLEAKARCNERSIVGHTRRKSFCDHEHNHHDRVAN